MASENYTHLTLGQHLSAQRIEQGKTQAEIASAAGISASYYSEIENSKCIPPPRIRLSQIILALGFCDLKACELERLAATERGLLYGDANLPEDVQTLIKDIRKHANEMNPRFIRGLRTKIRESIP